MATDQEIIARASGGLALYGMYVGESDEKVGRKKAVKQLLRAPEQCNLMNADQEYKVCSYSWCNIQASDSFREEVKNFGWSVALSLHANVCGFEGFEAGGGQAKSKQMSLSSQDMNKEACLMRIWYCPKASFAIPLHQMQLSEEALNDARRVKIFSEADKFLSQYNSHVSTAKYQIGGLLMKSLLIRATTSASLKQILEKVSNTANLALGVNFGLFSIGAKVDFTDEKGSSSTDQRANHLGTVEYVYTTLGPRKVEEKEFKTGLDDKSTWDIIDSPDLVENPDLVPVWEIPSVKNTEGLQLCCDLLREAWQRSVESIADYRRHSTIYSLLQSSYMEHVKSMLAVSSKFQDLQDLKMTLRKVWREKTENLDNSRKIDLFHLGEFHHLLDRLAKSTGSNDGRALVRSFIIRDVDWLEEKGIPLSNSVQDLLRNEVEPVVPLPPLEDMSPTGLLDRLKTLLGRRPSAGAGATATAFDPDAVGKAMRDFFRQNRKDGNPVGGVGKLIRVHGFDENGEVRDSTRVTREEVNALVDELESMVSGTPDSTDLREGNFS